jgi:uncharacterized oxidoreductase
MSFAPPVIARLRRSGKTKLEPSMPTVSALHLERLTATIFERCGAPPDHARIVAEHLVASNLAGHDSHGVIRIPQYLDLIWAGQLKPDARMQIVHEMAAGAVVDGHFGFGQVIARDAMLLAVNIARAAGVGAVTVRNCSHSGRIGAYSHMAASEGLVGIAAVNSGGGGQLVTPFGGAARRLSTNPISIAAPSGGPYPMVLDMATSVAPEGKVRTHHQAGKSLPPGWIIDASGNASVDAADFYGDPPGALLPLGGAVGYKGFGLAFMVDILAGALSGAGCCGGEPSAPSDGMLMIALDVGQFAPLAEFEQRVTQLVEHVKSCPKAEGFEQIHVPGEAEELARQRRLRDGIGIEPRLWARIGEICARLQILEPTAD